MTQEYSINILTQEREGIERMAEPVRIGVPIRKGIWFSEDGYEILDPSGAVYPCQTQCLNTWPDGSIKWLLVDFLANSPADTELLWTVEKRPSKSSIVDRITLEKCENIWKVNTGACCFSLSTDVLRPFTKVETSSSAVVLSDSFCRLDLPGIENCRPVIACCELESDGPLHTVIACNGGFEGTVLKFSCRLHFYAGKSAIKIEFTVQNPQAAKHPRGLWDLGDSGSVFIQHMSFGFVPTSDIIDSVQLSREVGDQYIVQSQAQQLKLYQESSGGEQWDSPNHKNYKGDMPLTFKGYRITSGEKLLSRGGRATPLLWAGTDSSGLSLTCSSFWQNFPKSLEYSNLQIEYALFPGYYPDSIELQGGEQKTHSFYVDFDSSPDELSWGRVPLNVIPTPETFFYSGVFSDLPGSSCLVDQFTSAEDLLAKREIIDEYGWRNFGDVYADHEAVESKGSDLFVSHYNNQYDFLAGAYKKAFSSPNSNWLKLASELAEHVLDIDIYHTDQDREEYNRGLFWHTDHYVSAGLATHRSYSKEQNATYELHAGGGGPGAEHCYTTGLKLHYYVTGNPFVKETLVSLADWGVLSLNGPQTILASLKRFVDNLKMFRYVGEHKQPFPTYPLTRGTGNVVTACLDAYELTGDSYWMRTISDILQRTLSPVEDVDLRDLLNSELRWSYTVLLASVGKYLDKKIDLGELDDSFDHARQSLLHFAFWMLDHEYPYLDKPEMLEYPNETWIAQDMRKSVVFFFAAKYADNLNQRAKFTQKAKDFFEYSETELLKKKSCIFIRPVALVLQNSWVKKELDNLPPCSNTTLERIAEDIPSLSLREVIGRFLWEVKKILPSTSIKREISWLKSRLS